MVTLYYDPSYAAAAYAFPTTRKARWIADSLQSHPIAGVTIESPPPLTEHDVCATHDSRYVSAVRTGEPRELAESQDLSWDPGLWPMVLASNGGAVAATLRAMKDGRAGSLSSGLHHARRERGFGYCTFNGLVLAAKAALAEGAGDVLILDLDAHCGGGTYEMIADDPRIWQADVSVDEFDCYKPGGRTTLDVVTRAEDYLQAIARRLDGLRSQPFGLCIYNAGVDPHEDCPEGGIEGIRDEHLRERDRLVFDWCRERDLPVAFVVAGGYVGPRLNETRLVELHRITLAASVE